MASHAIGDAAVDLVLDALEEAADGGPHPVRAGRTIGHRIEHGVMIRPDQVARLARMGMSVVVQPLFVTEFGDALADLFAGEQAGGNYFRMRSLADAGVQVIGSSDRPVANGSPLKGIQAMVERTTAAGGVFGPDERLTAAEALDCYTAGGARAAMRQSEQGSLTARRVADLVVLDGDPTTVDPDRIGAIAVVATVVGGHAAHDPAALFDHVAVAEANRPGE